MRHFKCLTAVLVLGLVGCTSIVPLNQTPDADFAFYPETAAAAWNLPLAAPEFSSAFPFLGLSQAHARGFKGQGVRVGVIDLFGGTHSWDSHHGWAVLETAITAAPKAGFSRIDLQQIDARRPFEAATLAEALRRARAAEDPFQVVSITVSWNVLGCSVGDHSGYREVKKQIDALAQSGVVVVAAAGNIGQHEPARFPGCLSNVVAAGGVYDRSYEHKFWQGRVMMGRPSCTDAPAQAGQPICFSNRADLYAPGGMVSGYRWAHVSSFDGTSVATPLVAGAIAVAMSAGHTPRQAVARLLQTADASYGAPKVNLVRALGL